MRRKKRPHRERPPIAIDRRIDKFGVFSVGKDATNVIIQGNGMRIVGPDGTEEQIFYRELLQTADEHQEILTLIDSIDGIRVSAIRSRALPKAVVEDRATSMLAEAWNALHNSDLKPRQPTREEDQGGIDGWIGDIPVQVRLLSDALTSTLGRNNFLSRYSLNQLDREVDAALESKKDVDEREKSRLVMVLVSLAPIGRAGRGQIARGRYDLRGYRSVWVYPWGEQIFELRVRSLAR